MTTPLPLIPEFFDDLAARSPQRVFLRAPKGEHWEEWTCEQVSREIQRTAKALVGFQRERETKVGILAKNCPHWVMADLAIWKAGQVSVPLYPTLSAENLRNIIAHSEIETLFLGEIPKRELLREIPTHLRVITFPGVFFEHGSSLGWHHLPEPDVSLPDKIRPDSLATIVYTSGTTGASKGACHSHENLAWAGTLGVREMGFRQGVEDFFSYLPMAHVAERLLVEVCGLYCAGRISFLDTLENLPRRLKEVRPTVFLAVPRIWQEFQNAILTKVGHGPFDLLMRIPFLNRGLAKWMRRKMGLDRAHTIISGSAPISFSLLQWFDALGIRIQEAYAMTENFCYSHVTRRNRIRYGFVGQPLPKVEVRSGPDGEILVKSPANTQGYFKEPELTRALFADQFIHTGDLGLVDAEGFLKLTGRSKEAFKTAKGKYVNPTAIEDKILKESFASQVCVVGQGQSQPLALVVLKPGLRSDKTLPERMRAARQAINQTLEGHERLLKFVLLESPWTVDQGLLTPTLKIRRAEIERHFEKYLPAWYETDEDVVIP